MTTKLWINQRAEIILPSIFGDDCPCLWELEREFELSDFVGGAFGFGNKLQFLLLRFGGFGYSAAYFLEILDDSVGKIDQSFNVDTTCEIMVDLTASFRASNRP